MLPEISLPKFSTTIKEIKTTFHFRPFMMKEERAILMAKAVGTDIEVRQTIEDVVQACLITNKPIVVEDLPAHIVDYLFMQMYVRSNSNVISVNFTCNNQYPVYEFIDKKDEETGEEYQEEVKSFAQCTEESVNMLPLDQIKLFYPENYEERKEIKVSDNVTLYLSAPKSRSIRNVYKMQEIDEETQKFTYSDEEREAAYEDLIYECIDKIVEVKGEDDEVIYTAADFTKEAFGNWVDNAPKHVAEKMTEFFAEMPTIYLEATMQCLNSKCLHKTKYALTGAKSFLDLC